MTRFTQVCVIFVILTLICLCLHCYNHCLVKLTLTVPPKMTVSCVYLWHWCVDLTETQLHLVVGHVAGHIIQVD